MLCDVDHFKSQKVIHGHEFGGDVPKSIATSLKSTARTYEVACRFGGGEFLVLCPDTDVVGANLLAERLRAGSQDHPKGVRILTCFSIAQTHKDISRYDDVPKFADTALQQAKQQGHNRVVGTAPPSGRRVVKRFLALALGLCVCGCQTLHPNGPVTPVVRESGENLFIRATESSSPTLLPNRSLKIGAVYAIDEDRAVVFGISHQEDEGVGVGAVPDTVALLQIGKGTVWKRTFQEYGISWARLLAYDAKHLVLVNEESLSPKLLCLNLEDGSLRWKELAPRCPQVPFAGILQNDALLILQTTSGRNREIFHEQLELARYALEDGKELWRAQMTARGLVNQRPVVRGEKVIFPAGAVQLRLDTGTKETQLGPREPTPHEAEWMGRMDMLCQGKNALYYTDWRGPGESRSVWIETPPSHQWRELWKEPLRLTPRSFGVHKGKLIFATVGDRTDHSLTVVQPTSPPRPRVVGFGDFEFSGELSRFVGGWKGEDANIVVADLERESLRIVAVPAYMRFKASFGLAALRVLSNARATYLFGSKGVARVDGATGQVKMAQLPFSLLDQLDELNEQLYEGEPREWARGSSLWFFAEDHCYCVNEKTLDVRAKF